MATADIFFSKMPLSAFRRLCDKSACAVDTVHAREWLQSVKQWTNAHSNIYRLSWFRDATFAERACLTCVCGMGWASIGYSSGFKGVS